MRCEYCGEVHYYVQASQSERYDHYKIYAGLSVGFFLGTLLVFAVLLVYCCWVR